MVLKNTDLDLGLDRTGSVYNTDIVDRSEVIGSHKNYVCLFCGVSSIYVRQRILILQKANQRRIHAFETWAREVAHDTANCQETKN